VHGVFGVKMELMMRVDQGRRLVHSQPSGHLKWSRFRRGECIFLQQKPCKKIIYCSPPHMKEWFLFLLAFKGNSFFFLFSDKLKTYRNIYKLEALIEAFKNCSLSIEESRVCGVWKFFFWL